jgi:hypothetical protein
MPSYGSNTGAEAYFTERLNTDAWDNALVKDRTAARAQATRAIDQLNFENCKNDPLQELQFPRGDDIVVPIEVEYATYELLLKLLEGVDVDQEAETIGVLSELYSGVRTTYDESHVNEHIRAGIPSIEAWRYLKPFLRDPRSLKVSRVN